MSEIDIVSVQPLSGLHWQTFDPFLFCAHHDDAFPPGNDAMGPDASLEGRMLGQDFTPKDGWRMYHGATVPGFPRHPHRGFETVTLARRGFVDHSDSLGARARFGQGDCQWMTAGAGIVHSEMMPLLDRGGPNHAEFFQIWLNLPSEDKLAAPHFSIFWSDTIPVHRFEDRGRTTVTTLAGMLEGQAPPPPPPRSWAARPDTEVAIWTIEMTSGARFVVPPSSLGLNRTLYFYEGASIRVAGRELPGHALLRLASDQAIEIVNGGQRSELLFLQGKPIAESVANYGPFVMNTPEEIRQAIRDYQRTEYGGWPWGSDDPVHARDAGRFAVLASGEEVRPKPFHR